MSAPEPLAVTTPGSSNGPQLLELCEGVYAAGKVAGIAACAPIMANLCSYVEQGALHLTGAQEVIDDARAAIRSAAKP